MHKHYFPNVTLNAMTRNYASGNAHIPKRRAKIIPIRTKEKYMDHFTYLMTLHRHSKPWTSSIFFCFREKTLKISKLSFRKSVVVVTEIFKQKEISSKRKICKT